jgi:hypothetical protein
MLQLRLKEKKRARCVGRISIKLAGIVLRHLSGMAARRSNDLTVRRKINAVVFEVREEMAKAALAMADQQGEPPLEQLD